MYSRLTIYSILPLLFLFGLTHILPAQNYRDQMILIRLSPGYCMVFGQVTDYDGEKLTRADISLYDPYSFDLVETIPVDDLGEYLFTLRKGQRVAFLIHKDGYFPYYHEMVIPDDAKDRYEYPIRLPDGIRKDYTLIYHPEGSIPANTGILEELISLLLNQTGLSLWMPDQENTLGKSRISFLDSLFLSRGIEAYRLLSGSLPGQTDQVVELNFETDADASLPATYDTESVATSREDQWTLQFSASKNKLSERDLKGLIDYQVFEGKDGFYRYTYGVFPTRQQANEAIPVLREKGFSQAFPKLIGNLKKL